MGKASSAKKVARAARAGGSRRPGQRRPLGFPIVVTAVVVCGVGLVGFARSSRDANAAPLSQANENFDHWHAAYGFSFCGEFQYGSEGTYLTDFLQDPQGIHTHGDGVIHIHPFLDSAGGRNARMRIFLDDVNLQVSDDEIVFPDGETWTEGEDTCPDPDDPEGEPVDGEIVLAKWNSAQDAADGERPNDVLTEDFGDVRFQNDLEAYMFAFVPEGELEDIPVRPGIMESLGNLSDVAQENPEADLDAPGSTTSSTEPASGSTTTVPGDTSSTTAPGDTSSTTAPDPSSTTSTTAGG
jgi:hypothetical protein